MDTNDVKKQKEDFERDKILFSLISETYNSEENRLNVIDDKSSKLIVFVGILISLQSSFGSFLLNDISKTAEFYNWYLLIFILSIILLIASIICGLYAYQIKSWKIAPKAATMIKYGKENKSKEDILRIVSQERSNAVEENAKKIKDKVKFIKYGFIFLLLGIICALIFIILLLYTK